MFWFQAVNTTGIAVTDGSPEGEIRSSQNKCWKPLGKSLAPIFPGVKATAACWVAGENRCFSQALQFFVVFPWHLTLSAGLDSTTTTTRYSSSTRYSRSCYLVKDNQQRHRVAVQQKAGVETCERALVFEKKTDTLFKMLLSRRYFFQPQ